MTWRPCKLGDVITLQRGHDLPEAQRRDGPIPIISSSGRTGTHDAAKATGPGVVTGRYGTLGEVYYVDEEYWPLNTALYVVDFKGSHPRFVAYFLKQALTNLQSDKAAVPGVNRNVLHALDVRVPDENTQQRIASILSAYDDLIENNRRRMALLEDAARQLYQEWFVRLRFPGREHTPIIEGRPRGWEHQSLRDVVENLDRLRVPLSGFEREARPGPFPYYGAAGVLGQVDNFLFDGRFLLVGEDGTVRTVRGTPMLQLVEGRFWVNNHAHVLRGTVLSTELLFCLLSEYPIAGHVTGVAQPKLTQGNLNRIPVLVPARPLRDAFQDFVEPLFAQRFTLQRATKRLESARDLLLPRLMSGEVSA